MKFIARVKIIYKMLFKYENVIIIEVNTKELSNFLSDETFNVITHSTLCKYPTEGIIKELAKEIDDTDLILSKASFWGKVIYEQIEKVNHESKTQ